MTTTYSGASCHCATLRLGFHVEPSRTHPGDELQIIITLLSGSNSQGAVKGSHSSFHQKKHHVEWKYQQSWSFPKTKSKCQSASASLVKAQGSDVKSLALISLIHLLWLVNPNTSSGWCGCGVIPLRARMEISVACMRDSLQGPGVQQH